MVATSKPRSLTRRQELFVREYLLDLTPADAYVRAGYRVTTRETAYVNSCKLLKNTKVLEAVEKAQAERMTRLELDADWVVLGFRMIYLMAKTDGQYTVALRALENIGKYLGLYAEHNRQKVYPDPEQLRAELEAAGFDFRRVNYPTKG